MLSKLSIGGDQFLDLVALQTGEFDAFWMEISGAREDQIQVGGESWQVGSVNSLTPARVPSQSLTLGISRANTPTKFTPVGDHTLLDSLRSTAVSYQQETTQVVDKNSQQHDVRMDYQAEVRS